MTNSYYAITLYVFSSLILIVGLIGAISFDYPVNRLFEDPTKPDRLLGVFTYIGCLLWSFTAAICLFGSGVLRACKNTRLAIFFALAGLLSLWLLFDDLFRFHEYVQSNYKNFGENGVYLVYGIFVASYLVFFRKTILATDFQLLGLALLFFSITLTIDVFIEPWLWRTGMWAIVIEDIPKFLGIVSWFGYFSKTCYLSCRNNGVIPTK